MKARYGSLKEYGELSFTPQPRPGAAGKKVRRRLTMEGMSSMAGSHQRRRRRRLWTAGVSGVGGTLSLLLALTFSSHTVDFFVLSVLSWSRDHQSERCDLLRTITTVRLPP